MKRVFLSILCGTVIALSAGPVRSANPSETQPPPVTPSALPTAYHDATCSNDTAERDRKRDAALAELGRRLSEEPPPSGDYQILNRSGHNYGARSLGE